MKTKTLSVMIAVLVLALVQMACSAVSGSPKPTATPQAPAAKATLAGSSSNSGFCPAPNANGPKPSGLVKSVTMAENTQGENKDPLNPTSTFGPKAEFHAVVAIEEAPANTTLKAVWFASDTKGAVKCDTKIDEYELTSEGTRNIDFSLAPNESWPAGTYRVEISVNGTLDQVVSFMVE